MYYVVLKPGAKDIRGKPLDEFVGIEFECECYQSMIIVKNHITKIPLEIPINQYIQLKESQV